MKKYQRGFVFLPLLVLVLAAAMLVGYVKYESAKKSSRSSGPIPDSVSSGTSSPSDLAVNATSSTASSVASSAASSTVPYATSTVSGESFPSESIISPDLLAVLKSFPYSESPAGQVRLESKLLFEESKTSPVPGAVQFQYVLTSKIPLDKAVFYIDCDPETVKLDFAEHSECRKPFAISLPDFTSNVFHAWYLLTDHKSHIVNVIAAGFSGSKLAGVSNAAGNGFSTITPDASCDMCKEKKQPDILILAPRTNQLWKYGETEKIAWQNPPELIGRTVKESIYLGTFFDFQPKRVKIFDDIAKISAKDGSMSWTVPAFGTAGLPPAEDYAVSIQLTDPFTGITHEGSSDLIQVAQGEKDTSDWKTYQNDDLGFSFRYPSDYSLKEEKDIPSDQSLALTLRKGAVYMSLAVEPLPNNDWDESGTFICDAKPVTPGCDLYKPERIRIMDGIPQKVVSLGGSGGDTERVWIQNGSSMFDFSEFKTFEEQDASTTVLDIAKTLQFF